MLVGLLCYVFGLDTLLSLTVCLSTQGWVVRKLINTNPGLKVNQQFNFSCIKEFLSPMFCEV